ncbi:MAG: hypothetical protein ACRCTM_12330 [Sphaerotilus sulfidivorans]|uniref:hypothetical protein n=1 Tax=Sphaerotilus sulfidivorans TaxID=639200 RepID=UPI003F40254D
MKNTLPRVEPLHCPNAAAYRLNSLITRTALAFTVLAPAIVPSCCIAARWAS